MKTRTGLAAASLLAIILIFCAWRSGSSTNNYAYKPTADTTPVKKRSYNREFRSRDLDEALQDVEKAMKELGKEFRVDMGDFSVEMEKAMKELKKMDLDAISRDIELSLDDIDWEKSEKDIQKAERELRNIDTEEIKRDIRKAMKEVNTEVFSRLNSDLIRKSVEVGLAGARVGIEAGLQGARIGLESLKKEILLLKEFTTELEKDGLVDMKKPYRIEVKDDTLYINGEKQSQEVNDKYRKYFRGRNYRWNNKEEGVRI